MKHVVSLMRVRNVSDYCQHLHQHLHIQLPASAVSRNGWPIAVRNAADFYLLPIFQICAYTYACCGDGGSFHWLELEGP